MSWFLKITGLSKLGGLLAAAGAAILAIGAIFLRGRRAGRKSEQAKQTEIIHEKVAKADQVRRDVRTDPVKRERVRKFDRD